MSTYLFAWNPKKWNWVTLEEQIEQLAETGLVSEMWSCASFKAVKPGDRAFLVKVGKHPKGIMGSGMVMTPPFLSKHWNGENKLVPRVMIQFDVLLNPAKEPILERDILSHGKLALQHWTPQASGISVKPKVVEELETVWFDFITSENIRNKPFEPDDKTEQILYTEGTGYQITTTRYERDPYARRECLMHYGYSCLVCGFNFEKTYGKLGANFIHVHHLTQLSVNGRKHKVDPIVDLRPVCPNCHAMIHRKKQPLSLDDLRKILK